MLSLTTISSCVLCVCACFTASVAFTNVITTTSNINTVVVEFPDSVNFEALTETEQNFIIADVLLSLEDVTDFERSEAIEVLLETNVAFVILRDDLSAVRVQNISDTFGAYLGVNDFLVLADTIGPATGTSTSLVDTSSIPCQQVSVIEYCEYTVSLSKAKASKSDGVTIPCVPLESSRSLSSPSKKKMAKNGYSKGKKKGKKEKLGRSEMKSVMASVSEKGTFVAPAVLLGCISVLAIYMFAVRYKWRHAVDEEQKVLASEHERFATI